MFWVLFVGVAIVVAAAVFLAQRQTADRDMMRMDPAAVQATGVAQSRPLNDAEQVLYARLVEALPECVVLAKVSFRSFIKPGDEGIKSGKHRVMYFRVASQTIDFLVCLKDFTVVAAVELDDGNPDHQRDFARDELLRAAGIAPLRLHAGEIPSVDALRGMFI